MSGPPPDADADDVFGRPPPGWAELSQVAADLWDGSELADEYPRAIDRIAVMRLPLFVVDLPAVSLGGVRRWLAGHRLSDGSGDGGPGVAKVRPADDDDLMGCLYAHGGHGYAFVAAADPPAERRLTLAHEVAHFLLDYLRPRRRVLAALGPAAADVLDGRRPATVAERAAAVLAHVRLGPHLHLIPADGPARSPGSGGSADVAADVAAGAGFVADADGPVIAAAERRADALAVELVAPRARVAERLWIASDGVAGWGGDRRMRIGLARDAGRSPDVPSPTETDGVAVAAALAAHFGLPPYAFARYLLSARRGPGPSPLLATARAALDRAGRRRQTESP